MTSREAVSDRLRQERKALITAFLTDRVSDFPAEQTRLLDDYLRDICRVLDDRPTLSPRDPYAIVALGGYGRGEMCIHSDVDLLFLFDEAIPENGVDFIRAVVYPLWDLGLHVSHNARTLAEPVEIPDDAVSVLTALLDARFVAGAAPLFAAFRKKFRETVVTPRSEVLIDWLIDTNRERHDHFGDSSYLLEPNLKEGQGGLRDYHTLMWVARIRTDIRQSRDLEFYGCLSHEEFRELSRALKFIWRVRNHLHHLAGKKHDRFGFQYQVEVADLLGYREKSGQQPVERFLGRLQEEMSYVKDLHLMFVYELESRSLDPEGTEETPVAGLQVRRGMIHFDSPQAVLQDPLLLLRIFQESARRQRPLGIEARRLVKNMRRYLTDKLCSDPRAVAAFEDILSAVPFRFSPLNEMLWTGLLTRFIPQLEAIRHRIQYDQYHLHPVDKHSLKVVRTLKMFGGPEDPSAGRLCGELYAALEDRRPLLWAALLHDIGKGEPGGDHAKKGVVIAAEILREKGYRDEWIETVCFLIREHLLLAKTATRRDIHDEETAIFCARRVQEPERLKMLYLLTVADSIATGPKAWNAWSLSLIQGLYFYSLRLLEQGELASRDAVERVAAKQAALLRLAATPEERDAARSIVPFMSPRYLLYAEPADMLTHVNLHGLMGKNPFAWKIEKTPSTGNGVRTVTICAKDHPGLFYKISGVFTLYGIDILNAQVYTWRNNAALDIFQVTPPPDPIFEADYWETASRRLRDTLTGRFDLCAEVKERIRERRPGRSPLQHRPTKVVIDNRSSSYFTIVEVFAYDFTGLLFLITEALFRLKLDVWLAKIATQVDQVVDVFYVRSFEGEKVDDPAEEETIRRTLIGAID
jgi:[protein-PII] uridylyltransferase